MTQFNINMRHFSGKVMPKRILKTSVVQKAFGRAVRSMRLDQDLSQEKLAELADLHTNYIGSVERGERNISLENIWKIAKGLKSHPRDLFK